MHKRAIHFSVENKPKTIQILFPFPQKFSCGTNSIIGENTVFLFSFSSIVLFLQFDPGLRNTWKVQWQESVVDLASARRTYLRK